MRKAPVEHSCGHKERFDWRRSSAKNPRRLENEQTRERRVAELMATPCRACRLIYELLEAGNPAGMFAVVEDAQAIMRVSLHDLRLFALAVMFSRDLPDNVRELASKLLQTQRR